jgi:hypothetical protein
MIEPVGGPDVDLAHGVAARLAGLSLDPRGSLPDVHAPSDAVRCGLLVDLALLGRLTPTDESILVDPEPVGFPPADQLLAAMDAEPDRSLDAWFDERRIGLRQVAAALVAAGCWEVRTAGVLRRRRHLDRERARTATDAATTLADDPTGWRPEDAAVTALASAAGLLGTTRTEGWDRDPPPVPDPVLAAAGPARWLCGAAVEHLAWSRRRDRLVAGAWTTGQSYP